MNLRIRPGIANDVPTLIVLQALSLQVLCAKDYNPAQMTALLDEQAKARQALDEIIWVAELGEQVVGFASLLKAQSRLVALYVHPEWVRQGLGRLLLATTETAAIQRQIRQMWVMSSLSAVPFYQSQGYQLHQATGFQTRTGVWIPGQLMEKQILPPAAIAKRIDRTSLILTLGLIGLLAGFSSTLAARNDKRPLKQPPVERTVPLHQLPGTLQL
jgi:putative acetyltransferase